MTIFDLAIAFAAVVVAVAVLRARRRRDQVDPLPVRSPLIWQNLLDDRLPAVARLSHGQREDFHAKVRTFLEKKRFIGCDGLEVTDEMKALIAGQACLMILRPGVKVYPRLKKVLLYPGPFLVPEPEQFFESDELQLVSDEPEERIGESWRGDQVVLSWPDVEAALDGDEVNVVVHEFAHQLDDEGHGQGAPVLLAQDYGQWSEVMKKEFERLRRHRRPPVLDPYGAESPAEFFGVVTEAYFQRGPELARHHKDLYDLLRGFYGFDTA